MATQGHGSPMRREMTQYKGQIQPPLATHQEVVRVDSRLTQMGERFNDRLHELINRIERLDHRLTTMEPNVMRLMAESSGPRSAPAVSIVPVQLPVQGGMSDLEPIMARLRSHDADMDRMREIIRTQQDSIDSIRRDLQHQVQSTSQLSSDIDERLHGEVQIATDTRLGQLSRVPLSRMTLEQMMAQFQPQIIPFRVPEFPPLRQVVPILRSAIDGFRVQPAIGYVPQPLIAHDGDRRQTPQPTDDDWDP